MKNQQRVASVLLGLFIFTMVYGLFAPRVGLPEIPGLMHLSTMAGFGFALVHAGTREGWKRAALFLGLTFVISLLFESVGVMTGWSTGIIIIPKTSAIGFSDWSRFSSLSRGL